MTETAIADHRITGDTQSATLVTDGPVDSLGCSRFAPPRVFGALLDDEVGRHLRVRPTGERSTPRQMYRPSLIYGLSGGPVARALGVARTGPGGVLLIGSSPVGRAIGRALQAPGLTVALWTANEEHARAAEADGLTVYQSDPTQDATENIPSELDGLDYALAVGDDEVLNAVVATDLSERFGQDHVLQLPVSQRQASTFLVRVQILFDRSATHDELLARIEASDEISTAKPSGANGPKGRPTGLGANGIAMFVLTPGKELDVVVADDRPELHDGQEVIGLRGQRSGEE